MAQRHSRVAILQNRSNWAPNDITTAKDDRPGAFDGHPVDSRSLMTPAGVQGVNNGTDAREDKWPIL